MATISVDAPNGDRANTLAAAAAEAGFANSAAGVKAMVVAFLRQKYEDQKRLESQRAVAVTVDTAVSTAHTNAVDIV